MNISQIPNEIWFIPLDIFSIICILIVIILSLIYFLIIIFDKTCHTIPMMLIGNSCLISFLSGCCIFNLNLFTFINDLKQISNEDSLCIFRGYTTYVSCCAFNYSFLIQSLYRYIKVVYPNFYFYQTLKCQLLIICFIWIFSLTFPFVFLFRNEILYNKDNQICQIPFQLSFSIIYLVNSAYLIPVLSIMLIYFKLILYVKQISQRVKTLNIIKRARRQLKMVQHTVIIITILVILCFPYAAFIFMSFFIPPPKYHFRISYIFAEISLVCVMFTLLYFTDPIKNSIKKKIHKQSETTEAVHMM